MANITVDITGTTGFSPSPYPQSGTVMQGNWVTFSSATSSAVEFHAQSGLFYLNGSDGETNTDCTPFWAPAAGSPPLSLCVAANPSVPTPYKLSLGSLPDGCVVTPSDGTINVSTKTVEWSERVTDPTDSGSRRPAPAPAMGARGSD
jgi:hypothetical protein